MAGITYYVDKYKFLIEPLNFNMQIELKNLLHYFTDIETQIIKNWLNEKNVLFARLYDKDITTNNMFCINSQT